MTGSTQFAWKRAAGGLHGSERPRDRAGTSCIPNNPASLTPVADNENVYVFFPDFGLLRYTRAGDERWRLPLGPFAEK